MLCLSCFMTFSRNVSHRKFISFDVFCQRKCSLLQIQIAQLFPHTERLMLPKQMHFKGKHSFFAFRYRADTFCSPNINIGSPYPTPPPPILLCSNICAGVTIGQTSSAPSFSVLRLLSDKPSTTPPLSSCLSAPASVYSYMPVYLVVLIYQREGGDM